MTYKCWERVRSPFFKQTSHERPVFITTIAFLILFLMPPLTVQSENLSRELIQQSDLRDGLIRHPKQDHKVFNRIATFPVFLNTDRELETVAEIVAATKDGNLLVYTDGETENIGFVDITDPYKPQGLGVVKVAGEPTSVDVHQGYALAAVNTSGGDFVNPSGQLQIIDIATKKIIRSIELGGQPDSLKVSPSGKYAAIAIENERDEDLGDGRPPQDPPGFVVLVDLVGPPANWRLRTVKLVGIPDKFPDDPEPEFVDINEKDIAAVTLQENNYVVLIDLKIGEAVKHWSAGLANVKKVDTVEDELITLDGKLKDRPREPDAITWISNYKLATADEGDLDGGTRGFTLYDSKGHIKFQPGNSVDYATVRVGHYPEDRSENKGNEPEAAEFGRYGKDQYLFIGSERASVVLVYKLVYGTPHLVQILPSSIGPEGLLAIPQRDLFVVATEVDDEAPAFRGSISIYKREPGKPTYPTIVSANRKNGRPIPWAALSALAVDRYTTSSSYPLRMYTGYDSFFRKSRIFEMEIPGPHHPAVITKEIVLRDRRGNTVDIDMEGIAVRPYKKGFWVVSEGAGTVGDSDRPFETPNLLLKVASSGKILEEIRLPEAVAKLQVRFGFEGVASVPQHSIKHEHVYVAFQREWSGDPDNRVRIGRYDTKKKEWRFFYYPIDEPADEGWVGLSEIVALDHDHFAVIERDNQGGLAAHIKKIYKFSVKDLTPRLQGEQFPTLVKSEVRNLIPDLQKGNGFVMEKVEGLAVVGNGHAYIVTDNDGVDDHSGETQFIHLGQIFP